MLKTNKEAKEKVAQTIMDLETGAIFKDGNSYIFDETVEKESQPKR